MMRKKPMLAYPASNKPIDYTKPTFMQPKLDGVRCLIQYDDGKVTAYSRTGKVWQNIEHITLNLCKFFDKHPNVILDGELYNHDFKDDFESIISMVRKTKPTAEDRVISAENVQFHCYDIVDEVLTFDMRIHFIKQSLPSSYCVKHVHTMRISSHENALMFHEGYVAGGYEGSILCTNDAYACKRSHNLRNACERLH